MHLFELGEYLAGVTKQGFACRRRAQAAGMAGEKRYAQRGFELGQAVAGGRGGEMHLGRRPRQAATVGNGGNESKVGQVVAHGFVHIECLL